MLYKYYSNTTTFEEHLCSEPVYLKHHIFRTAVLFPENQAPGTEVTAPAAWRQPSGPTAVSASTRQQNNSVGAVGLYRVPSELSRWPSPAAVSLQPLVDTCPQSGRLSWGPMCVSSREGTRYYLPDANVLCTPPHRVKDPSPHPISF